jgi:hypothetical protein
MECFTTEHIRLMVLGAFGHLFYTIGYVPVRPTARGKQGGREGESGLPF